MELNDLPQMGPCALKATSVKAEDEHANSAEPQALKIIATSSNSKMFTLSWHKPLVTWLEDLLVNLPRGIPRHVVRFMYAGDEVYTMKEIIRQVAEREHGILRRLQKFELPAVTPIAVVVGYHTREGESLEAILVTRHLKFSLPYRALLVRNLCPDTAERLTDALAMLLVRLHLADFYWGDVSLSNALFLRDADVFPVFLADAETGDLQAQLTDGRCEYDIDLARTSIIGEFMDLMPSKLLPGDVDEIEAGDCLVDRCHSLWSALTNIDKSSLDGMRKIEQRVNKLNDLGFDADELEMKTAEDDKRVLVRLRMADAGYANRKLLRFTGLDVRENQARRLLNDPDTYCAFTWREGEDPEIVAINWMCGVFEPTVRMTPREYYSQIEPAQFFHEVFDHRWFLAEKAGHDVPMGEAVTSCIDNALPSYSPDSKALAELNEEAGSDVIDDEFIYSNPDDDGYNPDDDPDAAVWSY